MRRFIVDPKVKTIVHLLLTFERIYLENAYASVYTALEGTVFGLSSDNDCTMLLTKKRFAQLRKILKMAITEQLTEQEKRKPLASRRYL